MILCFVLIFNSCNQTQTSNKQIEVQIRDFENIIARDTLVAVISTNSTDYFVYRGKPMGFHLELLEKICEHFELELQIIVENDIDKCFEYLKNGECDIVAQSLTITNLRKEEMAFTVPITETRQVLVQRICDSMITTPLQLGNKTIYVQKGTVFKQRLSNLAEEIAAPITVIEIDSLEVEGLIANVSEGIFDYTVCDESVALMDQRYYNNIDAHIAVSLEQNIAWAVNKTSTVLLDSVNNWMRNYILSNSYIYLYNKYYKHAGIQVNIKSDYFSGGKGQISDYDTWIKKYSKDINWDWRLLASLMYQESRFNHYAVSWAGAFGLMQIMPSTAEMLGIDSSSGIEAQIAAGTRLISMINKRVPAEITDLEIRQKYILAGYNAGYGHVEDAISLALKYDADPYKWEGNVAEFLIHKSNPDYYTDSVVQFGYCPGIHAVRYVKEIFDRYEHYRNVVPE